MVPGAGERGVTQALPVVVVHLDESCLGNGQAGATPGGAGGLIETTTKSGVQRRDFFLHAADTTNNRMALAGGIAALQLLAGKGQRMRVLIVSDSEYLIKGMREWVPAWKARGWTRKGGPIENLPLWQQLVSSAGNHEVQWTWVRGHQGHAKNEYANDLAVMAATDQHTSDGAEESGFEDWLDDKRSHGQYVDYDPDATFRRLAHRIEKGETIELRDAE
jgi:ribonuclease HI